MFFTLISAIITHATLLVFALSLAMLVWLHDVKSITNRFFLGFIVSIMLWDIANFASIFFVRPEYINLHYDLLAVKLVMVTAGLMSIFMPLFVYVFPKDEFTFSSGKKMFLSIVAPLYVISGFFVWSDFDLTKPVSIGSFTPQLTPNLPIMPLWILSSTALSFIAVGYLIVKYRKFEPEDKKNYLSTVIGLSSFALLPIILSLPVALWNDSRLNFYGPLAYTLIIYGVGYGILRRNAFHIKVLGTEIFLLIVGLLGVVVLASLLEV